jgi:WD40 repeat protein
VHFTSDGSRLVTVVTNEHLIVYCLDYKARMRDHRHNISAVSFHPDGKKFVAASNDGTVRFYNTRGPSKHAVITGHEDAVTVAEFSPDGNTLLTASLDGTLRLWPMDPMALAMRRLSRDMTKSEKVKLGRDLAGN